MKRETMVPRPDWQAKCEDCGFHFHTIDGTYWDESACYRLTADQVDTLEAATEELHRICLEACEHVVARRRLAEFAIPAPFHETVTSSWRDEEPSLYGRFDLAWTGAGEPKMLEYNADTPTALLEASVVQWFWMKEVKPGSDQFNSLHEQLIDRWKTLAARIPRDETLYFACVKDAPEDLGNLEYLRDTAMQAGYATRLVHIEDIGWDGRLAAFVDLEGAPMRSLFKLYPWEWLVRDEFGRHLVEPRVRLVEPAWKMLLSNKAILAVLWELYPDHPNLVPAYRDPARITGDYVRKPILSREGANIALRRKSGAMLTEGTYGAEGCVYQALAPLASTGGKHAVIGAWVVGDRAAGIGIREDDSPITRDTSRFVPHYFV